MPNSPSSPVRLEFAPDFKRNLRGLAKKYRHIRSDIEPMIGRLQAGEILGDQVPGTSHAIFKVRVTNSDTRKGKRSGYRLIYHLAGNRRIILVAIYSKLDQGDIPANRIRRILSDLQKEEQR
jgi:mRNA-degrading endonuclease RelE of RelBE toxin-antitoxin system